MSPRKLLFSLLCLFAFAVYAQNRLKPYEEYIEKYAEIAVRQQKLHGIPASITLAQGLLESGAGRSQLAVRSNNHFGIKCHDSWQGDTVMAFDDGVNSCFRKYKKVEESFDDHSMFLVRGRRYAGLFLLKATDYKGWAHGIKQAGYATDPSYSDKLIRIIETYGLDKIAEGKKYSSPTESKQEEIKINVKEAKKAKKEAEKAAKKAADDAKKAIRNEERKARRTVRDSIYGSYSIFKNDILSNVKDYKAIKPTPSVQTINPLSEHVLFYSGTTPYVKAQYGDSFESLADEFGLSPSLIRRINEFPLNHILKSGEPVYLDTKTTWWEGEKPYHVVQDGESMHSIAQKYALKLDALFKMNGMKPGDVLVKGQKIKLRNPEQMSTISRAMNDAFSKADSANINTTK